MTASGIFLPFCLPWICWWRLFYFSPSELGQWKWFNLVPLTGTDQKTLRRALPMARLQRRDWSAFGSAQDASGTEGRLNGTISSMDGHSLFFYTQSNHYQYQWWISKNTADKTFNAITSATDYNSVPIFVHVLTYRHTCAHIWMHWQQNLNKQSPLYVWAYSYLWAYKVINSIKMYESVCVSMIIAGGLEKGKSGRD